MCSMPTSLNWEELDKRGITHVLSILSYPMKNIEEKFADKGIQYLTLTGIEDKRSCDILKFIPESNDFIKQALNECDVNNVLVHCGAGISKSAAFCSAYMI